MRLSTITFIVLLLTLFGCETKPNRALYKIIMERAPEHGQIVNLADLVEGDWDRVIFFPRLTPLSQILKEVAFPKTSYNEFSAYIVFARGNEPIVIKKRNYSAYGVCNRTVALHDNHQKKEVRVFHRHESHFRAEHKRDGEIHNIILVPVSPLSAK